MSVNSITQDAYGGACAAQINKTFHSFMKHVQQDVWERDHG